MSVRRQLVPSLFLFAVVGSVLALPATASAAPLNPGAAAPAAPAAQAPVPNAPVPAAQAPVPNAPVPNAPVPNAPVPNAAYPPPAPTASVSTTTPRVGSNVGVSYQGFRAFERVTVDMVPAFRHLGAFRSNQVGAGAGGIRIPGGVRGTQILLFTGVGTGRVATVIINVLGPNGGSANEGGGAGGPVAGAPGGGTSGGNSSSNAGRAGGMGSGGVSGSQSAGGSAGLASTGFSAWEYARIAGGLILAGAALGLIGRRTRRARRTA
jgi:hypothetical protein